jgi:hypothetical protein
MTCFFNNFRSSDSRIRTLCFIYFSPMTELCDWHQESDHQSDWSNPFLFENGMRWMKAGRQSGSSQLKLQHTIFPHHQLRLALKRLLSQFHIASFRWSGDAFWANENRDRDSKKEFLLKKLHRKIQSVPPTWVTSLIWRCRKDHEHVHGIRHDVEG